MASLFQGVQKSVARSKGGKRYEKHWHTMLAPLEDEQADSGRDGRDMLNALWKQSVEAMYSSDRFRLRYEKVGIPLEEGVRPQQRLVVESGVYRIAPFETECHEMIVEALMDHIREHGDEIDCIVELGSGTGRNLFNLAVKRRDCITKLLTAENAPGSWPFADRSR